MFQRQGTSQVLMGLDDPYPLGEMESDKQSSYPGKILDLAIEKDLISEQEKNEIWEDNVLQWIFGDEDAAKQKLINKIIN